jgi:hypothetical protein
VSLAMDSAPRAHQFDHDQSRSAFAQRDAGIAHLKKQGAISGNPFNERGLTHSHLAQTLAGFGRPGEFAHPSKRSLGKLREQNPLGSERVSG